MLSKHTLHSMNTSLTTAITWLQALQIKDDTLWGTTKSGEINWIIHYAMAPKQLREDNAS